MKVCILVLLLLVLVSTIAGATTYTTQWRSVQPYVIMYPLQYKWSVESTAGLNSPYEDNWGIQEMGMSGFTAGWTGTYGYSNMLHVYAFAFLTTDVPSNATITNIAIRFSREGGTTQNRYGVKDYVVKLTKGGSFQYGGSVLGTANKANCYSGATSPYAWPNSWTTVTYSGDYTYWGIPNPSDLTPSDVSGLGIEIAAQAVSLSGLQGWGGQAQCKDWPIDCQITYTAP